MSRLHVIIPVRAGGNADLTIDSLDRSTYREHMSITIQHDHWGNANRCRNEGFERAPESELILFSDDDISWKSNGIDRMVVALDTHPEAAYAFGSYEMGGKLYCQQQFNLEALRRTNLASTMSVIRRHLFAGFDESLQRLQDWDLFLTMAAAGHYGVHCGGGPIFQTDIREGITYGPVTWAQAFEALRKKHGL